MSTFGNPKILRCNQKKICLRCSIYAVSCHLRVLYLSDNFYMLKDYQCDCPVPCDSITFKPALSYAAFPSSSLVSSVVKNLYPPNSPMITPEVIKGAEEYMRYVLESRKSG